MNGRCPKCKSEIIISKKEVLIECNYCKSKLLLATINGKKELHDVTPKDDLKK